MEHIQDVKIAAGGLIQQINEQVSSESHSELIQFSVACVRSSVIVFDQV